MHSLNITIDDTAAQEIKAIELIKEKYPNAIIAEREKNGNWLCYMNMIELDAILQNEDMDILEYTEIRQYVSMKRKRCLPNTTKFAYKKTVYFTGSTIYGAFTMVGERGAEVANILPRS